MQKQQISLSFKIALAMLWALPQMSTDIYLPSIPSMAKYFNTSLSMIQYTIFFYTIGFSLGALFFGPASDRIGRRPVILCSLTLGTVGSIIALFTSSLDMLFFARFIQGFALVGIGSTIRALVKDISTDRESMARLGAMLGIIVPISSAMAPIIGGYIEHYLSWRFSFGFLLLLIILFLIYTIKLLPETNLNKLNRPIKYMATDYLHVLTNLTFIRYNILTACALSATFAYLTVSPHLLQVNVGLSANKVGYTYLLISGALIGTSYLNTKLIYHYGIDKMLYFGVKLIFASGVIFLLCGVLQFINIYSIMIPMFILVCGCGFIFPNASAGGLSLFDNNAGTAAAIYSFVQMLGASAGSGLISLMTTYGNPEACLGLITISAGLIGVIFTRQILKNSTKEAMEDGN